MSTHNGDTWLGQVAQRMKDEMENGMAPSPERLTAQELVGKYGYAIRGPWINGLIQNQLERLQLRTVPDFTTVWQGSIISIEMDEDVSGATSNGKRSDPTHRIDLLDAAHNEPVRVTPDNPLSVAVTKMQLHDFSQLPVMTSPRELKGIISWKSIGARLALGRDPKFVRDCMEAAEEIPKDTTLFEAIRVITVHGYVLVRDQQNGNTICGIVTASDLADQFVQLASPFLLVGEIEGHLRNLLHGKFTLEELKSVALNEDIEGFANLTIGDYCQLLGNPSNWERLNLLIDRSEFVKHLDSIRQIRNHVMHFNPEGISPESIQQLKDVARFFNDLVKIGAM